MIVIDAAEVELIKQQADDSWVCFEDVDDQKYVVINNTVDETEDSVEQDIPSTPAAPKINQDSSSFLRSLTPTLLVVNLDLVAAKFDQFLIYHEEEHYAIAGLGLVVDLDKFKTDLHKDVMTEV